MKPKPPFFRIKNGVVDEAREWFGTSAEKIIEQESETLTPAEYLGREAEFRRRRARAWIRSQ